MEFANGQPCWVDIMVKDSATQQAYLDFLSGLFGLRWEVGGPETGYYGMGFLGDAAVLAVGQNEHGAGVPSVYLHVDDIHASVQAAKEAGAHVFLEPMQVMEAGSLAMAADPTGAVFGMWQGNLMPGFGVVDAPGAFCWFDTMSTDPTASSAFYQAAFGLGFAPTGDGGILTAGTDWVASISTAVPGTPSFWNPIFLVTDIDASEARARELGCEVLMSHMPVPGGIASGVREPQLGLTVTMFQTVRDDVE